MGKPATFEQAMRAQIEIQKAALESAAPHVRALRLEAMARFESSGLPARKDEAWRWTDLRALDAMLPGPAPLTGADIDNLKGPFAGFDAIRLVFVNGELREDQSSLSGLPGGLHIGSLRSALKNEPELAEFLRQSPAGGSAPFLALNTALLNDGAFIRLEDNVRLQKPLHVVFFNSGANHVRNLIMLGANAGAVLLESHYGAHDADYFVNQASNVALGSGARLAHYRDQAESAGALHFHFLRARLAAGSNYDGFTLTRGARLSRNETHVEIEGQGADCALNGAYMLGGAQVSDTTSVIDHAQADAKSSQVFRGVLDGHSRGVFQGRIHVRQIAQRTDARQQIKALLLSPHAEQNSKPELEILADDVQCAHGASVGQLDAAALFYLRSRGIPFSKARAMLTGAFLSDAVAQIRGGEALGAEPLQQAIGEAVEEWLLQRMDAEND